MGKTEDANWMTSPTQWTWVWAKSKRWWRTGKPVMLPSIGLQSQGMTEWVSKNNKGMCSRPTILKLCSIQGFPWSSLRKESACSAGDPGSIPRLARPLGEGNGKPLQYPFLENPMDRGSGWTATHGIAELGTTGWLTHFVWFAVLCTSWESSWFSTGYSILGAWDQWLILGIWGRKRC